SASCAPRMIINSRRGRGVLASRRSDQAKSSHVRSMAGELARTRYRFGTATPRARTLSNSFATSAGAASSEIVGSRAISPPSSALPGAQIAVDHRQPIAHAQGQHLVVEVVM